jgi:DNA-binding MarR family transcriptional regulator
VPGDFPGLERECYRHRPSLIWTDRDPMTSVVPLTTAEEALLGALMQIASALPRRIDEDLNGSVGLAANEYCILRTLSEAPHQEARMLELARAACVSQSRMSRLVDDMQACGFVGKVRSTTDGRGQVANLASAGAMKLAAAWPVHILSVRARVFDQVDPVLVDATAEVLSKVTRALDDPRPVTR